MCESKNLLKKYLDSIMYQKKYSTYTVENYERDLNDYLEFLSFNNIEYGSIQYHDIQQYMSFLYDKKYKKTSINRKLSAIRGFYSYLCEENLIKSNPFDNVSSLKKYRKLPNYLYTNEIEKMLNVEETDTAINVRNELIIELLYSTGVRVSELVNIKMSDINIDAKTIKILGKGHKERIVLYGDYAAEKIDKYISFSRIQLLGNKKSEYLFLNSRGGALTDRSVRNIINLVASKSRVNSHVTPHTLRHTFATHLLNEGADLLTVKELLGHKNLSTTSIYTHLSKEHLRNVYLSSHPRSQNNVNQRKHI